MFGRLRRKRQLEEASVRMRREHEAWLSRALADSSAHGRIPTREQAVGGFSGLLATPRGREWARRWWADRLES